MKTKELIRQLQEADPTGEVECSLGNCDIYFVERLPAYYDGSQQVLIRDESLKPFWNIVGGKVRSHGDKVVLKTMALSDLVCDNPELQIDCSELGETRAAEYQAYMERSRQLGRDVDRDIEWMAFKEWAKEKAAQFPFEEENDSWEPSARGFFNAHIVPNADLPEDLRSRGDISYHNRRRMVWDREIEVSWGGLDVKFKKREKATP